MRRHRLRWWEALPWIAGHRLLFRLSRLSGFRLRASGRRFCSRSRSISRSAMPASSRSAMRRSSAPAPTRSECWRLTTSGPSRSRACCSPPLAAAVVGFLSGLVLLRTTGLTLLMLTLCTMALLVRGGQHGAPPIPAASTGCRVCRSRRCSACSNSIRFTPIRNISIALGVLLVCFVFVRTLVYSPFGQSLTGIRENVLRMHAIGSPVRRRLDHLLHHLGGARRRRRRAVGADQRLRQS